MALGKMPILYLSDVTPSFSADELLLEMVVVPHGTAYCTVLPCLLSARYAWYRNARTPGKRVSMAQSTERRGPVRHVTRYEGVRTACCPEPRGKYCTGSGTGGGGYGTESSGTKGPSWREVRYGGVIMERSPVHRGQYSTEPGTKGSVRDGVRYGGVSTARRPVRRG